MNATETRWTYRFVNLHDGDDTERCEDDYSIVEQPHGWIVTGAGLPVRRFNDADDAATFIHRRMEREQFWPNVWYVNERGSEDLCVLEPT